jgi:hypothetical protein
MAAVLDVSLAVGATNTSLTTLTENGQVVVAPKGDARFKIEHLQSAGVWSTIYWGSHGAVLDYIGQSLRITNEGPITSRISIGQK